MKSLSYIEEVYKEINHAFDSNTTPSSLIDVRKLEVSSTDAYLFTGKRTKINATCPKYQSERYLSEGITKFSLTTSTLQKTNVNLYIMFPTVWLHYLPSYLS